MQAGMQAGNACMHHAGQQERTLRKQGHPLLVIRFCEPLHSHQAQVDILQGPHGQ